MSWRKFWARISPAYVIAILALAIAIGSWGIQLGRQGQATESPSTSENTKSIPSGVPSEFNSLFEVWATLKREHVLQNSLDATELSRGAIKGMLEALDDPYASYLTSQQYNLESQDFEGLFEGIGAQVTMRNGKITVVAPLPDTPAERAGMRPGDTILEIDGESTEGINLLEAVSKIRGTKDEPVNLLILRKTGGDPVEMTIIRGVIELKSVTMRMIVGQIAELRLTSFTETTNQEMAEALEKVKRFKACGVILDMRNNPGGLLDSVVSVTSQFIDEGLVLYEIDGRGTRRDWRTRPGGLATDIPLVLLVNEFSASGSEVLAGALMDRGRATVIGVKTFGKGSVNTLRNLSDGAGLYFTTARWYTPDGKLIEGEGLEPI